MADRQLPWTDIVEALGQPRLEDLHAGLKADGVSELDRDAFVLHRSAGAVLRELVPEGGPPDAVNAYGTLLHMLYVMWNRGWPVRSVTTVELRHTITCFPVPGPRSPVAEYVQLPPRLVWAPGEPAEPVDGLFVVGHEGRLRVLAVLGMNELRAGFTTMEAEARLPLEQPGSRDDGTAAYANVLPGGEKGGLLSLLNGAELAWLGLVLSSSRP